MMSNYNYKSIVYFGFNNLLYDRRGVENVIIFQADFCGFYNKYYIHWSNRNEIYRYKDIVCIGLKKNHLINCFEINALLKKIKRKSSGEIFIHSHNPIMSLFLVKTTDLLTVHDGLYYLSKSKRVNYAFIFALLEKILYLRCHHVHFISKFTKDKSLFGLKRKNYTIIPNTSYLEKLVSKYKFNIATPEDNSKNTLCYNILVVRTIEERAGLEILLEAALLLKEYTFNIAGKGPLLKYYTDIIIKRNIKNINFLGYVSVNDLIKLYVMSDLVIIPALYGEGFGLPIIEAYLFDKPVFASNIGAIPEVIIDEFFLFENKVEILVEKIRNFSPKSRTGFQQYYNKKFSNEIIGFEYERLYNSILQQK